MAVRRGLLLLAALISSCAALHASPRAPPAKGEEASRLLGGHHVANATGALTMAVKGHEVSAVSAGWTGKVVFGVFTSAGPRYHENMLAELDTWAASPAKEGRFVAVGGHNYPDDWQASNILKSECCDDMRCISCKEATLLAEGAARGADWLFVIGEDNYVHTGRIDEFLSDKDPDSPVAYGCVGCGKGMYCRDNQDFNEDGGFCGGGGYIISRAALQRLLANGAPELHKIYDASFSPNDMTTSCQLRKDNVVLGHVANMYGYVMTDINEWKHIAREDFLVIHYQTPASMRWFHAVLQGFPDSVKQPLEEAAFKNGCAIDVGGDRFKTRYNACYEKKYGVKPPM